MKLAIITDTHFGARNDSLPMQQNMKKFYDNVFFPALDEHDVKHVLHGGDYGDRRKYINFQTAKFIEDSYRTPLRKRNIPEDVIVGNHDIFYRSSTELNSVTELYRHDESLAVFTQPIERDFDGCGILLLPWIADNNRDLSMKMIAESKCSIVLGHLEIAGFQMYRGMPNHEGLTPQMFDRFELVMSGHFHHKSHSGPIHYLGAPYAMIWSDFRDPRGFHIFDTDTHELMFIENPYSIFERIVYDDEGKTHDYIKELGQRILAKNSPFQNAYVKVIVKSKNQPYWFDLLMDSLYKVTQDVIVVDDIVVQDDDVDASADRTPDVDTLTLMRDYVETLNISCDKEELVSYLSHKYQEALSANQSARLS